MRVSDIQEVLNQLRPFLFNYMVEEGVYQTDSPKPRDYFLCPNPNHKDTSPSAHLIGNGEKGFCFGCSVPFDLMTLNHWKTGAPLSGPSFVINNLMPLCKRFGVPFDLGDLTEEDRFRIDSYQSATMASEYIINQAWPDSLKEYIEGRGLTIDFCKSIGIGVVPNFDKFESYMKKMYTQVFLRETSFLRPAMFGPNNIIFTIKDPSGAPVGFISRDMNFEERYRYWQEEKNKAGPPPRKYDSSSETNRIYFKRELLFGFSDFLKNREEEDPLYLFEGQFDWAVALAKGFKNCCALGGKVLTSQHLSLLRKHKVKRIVLVLDGDDKGRAAVKGLLLGEKDATGLLLSANFLKTLVVSLPDKHDPSSFICEFGIDAFQALPVINSFSWALTNFDEDDDPAKICNAMIPFILAEDNYIQREYLVRTLSDVTRVSIKAIEDELNRREDVSLARLEKEKIAIAQEALRELVHEGASHHVLRTALDRIEELDRTCVADPLSVEETLSALVDQIEKEGQLEGPSGFRLRQLTNLQAAWNGDVQGTVLAIGGVANSGKCRRFDDLVLQQDGSYQTIQEIYDLKAGSVLTMDSRHQIIGGEISDYFDSGVIPTLDLKLRNGLEDHPSLNHPYYTLSGWKKASELHVGDRVAVVRRYSCFDNLTSPLRQAELFVLAGLLAEGGLSQGAVKFTNMDAEIVSLYERSVLELWPGVEFTFDGITSRVKDPTVSGNRARDYCLAKGILNHTSKTKLIPQDVFRCSKSDVAKFLGFFWSCDGWVSSDREAFQIGLSLANRKMLEQIRHLLLRFDIYTTMTHSTSSYTGSEKRFDRWSLCIGDIASARKFQEQIPLYVNHKRENLREIMGMGIGENRSPYNQNFPPELWDYILERCEDLGLSHNKLCGLAFGYKEVQRDRTDKTRMVPARKIWPGESISQVSLRQIARSLGDDFLLSLACGDIVFDEIVSIEDGGLHQCYDITVPGTHNFIANDIVVHNSALMSQLGCELVECNEDAVCLMLTIDDNRQQMNRRFAVQFAVQEAMRIGSPLATKLTLNKMANPKFWIEQYPVDNAGLMDLREFGYDKLRRYVKEERLHIKDMTHGSTLLFLEKMVKRAKHDYPDKRIIVILDNFHKAQDFAGQDERTATKRKSQLLKTNIAQGYGVTVVSTFEYKKIETGKRPTNNDLREAVNIEYDINYLEHLFNALKAARDTGNEDRCLLWHGHPFNKLPIVEGSVGKNKINELTPTHYYKFYPAQSRYEVITPEEAMVITDTNRIDIAREEGRNIAWDKGRKIEIPHEELKLSGVDITWADAPMVSNA